MMFPKLQAALKKSSTSVITFSSNPREVWFMLDFWEDVLRAIAFIIEEYLENLIKQKRLNMAQFFNNHVKNVMYIM